ncbi:MAG TPA: UDP-N-acetylmuramoyl-tripeptide--D-alanyl-D-alanine ligase [Anaerolineae bacterium]|nr:UDP-N-acetylmuramoyl-tripeptide--D-alanyl-D-alanine ligase [Anaerolineae bacterium]HQH38631.1 UDP-N-acetylmuramoyl-tripeptide--D-alanyl-D-alanine ligase [Anaerolineae bacterium]
MEKQLTLAYLIEGLSGWHPHNMAMPVRPILDSRAAEAGTVFFAFKGETVDGHDYVGDAFARGAVAAVVERDVDVPANILTLGQSAADETLKTPLLIRVPNTLQALQTAARFWRRQLNTRVIGITGSVGKTTTKEVVTKVLASRYHVLRSTGSYNNEIGLPLTLLQLSDAHERVVLEMGMYVRGDIRFLAEIAQPQVGIVTNVEAVHLERAGTIENIALGKQELVEILPPAPEGVAILNYDDQRVRAMAEHTSARVFFYGLAPQADLWADEVESQGLEGIRLRLHYGPDHVYVKVPLLGQHSAHTVLRAAAAGLVEGLDWQEIVEGLRAPGAQLRLVTVPGLHDSLILDDTYNSSPASALAALNLLQDMEGRKIAVLGDMLELGDYEEAGHLKVGCRAAGIVAELITMGERAHYIAQGAELCGLPHSHIHETQDSESAIAVLREILQPQDIILVKGSRGMKMEQIVAAISREVV